jgi:gliding motility-associated-like protein
MNWLFRILLIVAILVNSAHVQAQWQWVQQGAKLISSDNVGRAFLGESVSISDDGKTIIAGGDADNGGVGAAWIYTYNGTDFVQLGNKLVGTGDIFGRYGTNQGTSVDISSDGKLAIVGGEGDNYEIGAIWIYTFNGTNYVQLGSKLVGSGFGYYASQGRSLSLSGDNRTIIVGGPEDYNNGSFTGAAWIYTFNGSGFVQFGNKLVGSGVNECRLCREGNSVSISEDGSTAILGGFGDNSGIGAIWVFTFDGTNYVQLGSKIVGTGAVGASNQGKSVSISADGKTFITGGDYDNGGIGAIWVYTFNGTNFVQAGEKLVGTGTVSLYSSRQGYAVDISKDGKIILTGGFQDNGIGATWVFSFNGSNFKQTGTKFYGTGNIGSQGANQGYSVSLSSLCTAVIGGITDNCPTCTGALWVFTPTCLIPTITGISTFPGMCSGQSVVLSITSINQPQLYQWYKDNSLIPGATNSTLSLSSITSLSSGNYSCEIRNNCSAITSPGIALTVKPTPTITGSVFPASVCNGQPVLITATGTPLISISGGGVLGTSFIPSFSQIYTMTGIGSNGCKSMDTVSLGVKDLPLLNIAGNNYFCLGTSAYLIASGANTYQWSNNSTTSAIVVAPESSTNYVLTGTGINGCISIITVPVYLSALAPIYINGNSTVCIGDSVHLNVKDVSNIKWSNNATTTSISLLPVSTLPVSITGITNGGCLGQGFATITLNEKPSLAILGNSSVCKGEFVSLTITGAKTYKWSNNSTNSTISVFPQSAVSYMITGTGVNGCFNTTIVDISIKESPSLNISDKSICEGTNAILNVSGADKYVWNNGAIGSSIEVSPTHTTEFVVTGTGTNNCVSVAPVNVFVNRKPKVSLDLSGINYLCNTVGSISLSGGSPPLGKYFYLNSNITQMDISKGGEYSIIYTYTDGNLCTSSISGILSSEICLGPCERPNPPCSCTNTCPPHFKIYTGITPNGDGKNETWLIDSLFPPNHVTILDKWGNQVFQKENYNNDWDGKQNDKDLPSGIYYYVLETGDNKKRFAGTVSILR